MSAPSLAFVQVKSFGDLTIAAAAVRRLPPAARAECGLLTGLHLTDLCRVLAPDCVTETLDTRDASVPALFDLKRRGALAGLRSAARLKRALAQPMSGATLVFERLSMRERYVAGTRRCVTLPAAANVYAAHEAFLESALPGVTLASSALAHDPAGPDNRRIGLFPFSRVVVKNLPVDLVTTAAARCTRSGFQPVVQLLEGEQFPALDGVACERIPREFGALATAIRSLRAVVSADSLPAHLAEYLARPQYVALPAKNTYWLPRTAFEGDHWGLFDHQKELIRRLDGFLATLQ